MFSLEIIVTSYGRDWGQSWHQAITKTHVDNLIDL